MDIMFIYQIYRPRNARQCNRIKAGVISVGWVVPYTYIKYILICI